MSKSKEVLKKEAEELGINTESLTTAKALSAAIDNAKSKDKEPESKDSKQQVTLDDAIAEAEANLVKLKAEKAKAADAERRAEREKENANDKRPKYKHTNEVVYRFKKDTPETLNIDGAPKKISAIIKNKEIMAELVEGNSNYIEPVI